MKILLINNHTRHLSDLEDALTSHDLEVREYHPGLDFSCAKKDLVILSGGGGEGLEIHDEHQPGKLWYEDEMEFVRSTTKPVLGICMGFEVITRAFGAGVQRMAEGVEGFIELSTTPAGKALFTKSRLKQFESHDWHVPKTPKDFTILAQSENGIEIIQHKNRPIIATQFHPEKGGTISVANLFSALTF